MNYDLIIVGGGIAGSTLALTMARHGASVLVIEREERFRERIRGEGLHVWGTVDARALGIFDLLLDGCAHELEHLSVYHDERLVSQRTLPATTPSRGCEMTFFHPAMQETLICAARAAGAEVWRGATVTGVTPGDPPSVTIQCNKSEVHATGRLVIGADGRRSRVRTWAGFPTNRDPNNLLIIGVLVSDLPADDRCLHKFTRPGAAWNTQFIPLGSGRYRCYIPTGDRNRHTAIGGEAGIKRFIDYALDSAVPKDWLESMRIVGPLASFEGAAWWVDHPYRDNVALIGDAAAAPDPCFGNGLSLALRDVSILSRCLLEDGDWNRAAEWYAREHDRNFKVIHTLEQWAAIANFSTDPAQQQAREHAWSAITQGVAPDIIGRGPDQPADEAARMRFLGY